VKTKSHRLGLAMAFSLVLVAAIAYRIGRAGATGGIPAMNPLVYSGSLLFNGSPVTGPQSVSIGLWTDLSTGTRACFTQPMQPVTFDPSGRFQVPLDPTCLDAVHNNQDLWVQVQVGNMLIAPRTKLGAVPYAVEASHAAETSRQVITSPDGGAVISVGGTVCGAAVTPDGGGFDGAGRGGYVGAKGMCEAKCNNSPTAHMCSSEEVVRSAQLGVSLSSGWYASGVEAAYADPSGLGAANGTPSVDCHGFTSAAGSINAMFWQGTYPAQIGCNNALPVLCCD
jgi:hypothetical protein